MRRQTPYEDDIKVDTLWEETIVTMVTHTHEAVEAYEDDINEDNECGRYHQDHAVD